MRDLPQRAPVRADALGKGWRSAEQYDGRKGHPPAGAQAGQQILIEPDARDSQPVALRVEPLQLLYRRGPVERSQYAAAGQKAFREVDASLAVVEDSEVAPQDVVPQLQIAQPYFAGPRKPGVDALPVHDTQHQCLLAHQARGCVANEVAKRVARRPVVEQRVPFEQGLLPHGEHRVARAELNQIRYVEQHR